MEGTAESDDVARTAGDQWVDRLEREAAGTSRCSGSARLAAAAVPSARADETTCTNNPVPPANPRIVRGTLDGLHFNVLVPSDYATDTSRRYPVLWLLHGGDYNENNWLDQTDVLKFTAPFT